LLYKPFVEGSFGHRS